MARVKIANPTRPEALSRDRERRGSKSAGYTTVYELDHPGATATAEFQAMRGWYHFAPHVRSRTQVILPTG